MWESEEDLNPKWWDGEDWMDREPSTKRRLTAGKSYPGNEKGRGHSPRCVQPVLLGAGVGMVEGTEGRRTLSCISSLSLNSVAASLQLS